MKLQIAAVLVLSMAVSAGAQKNKPAPGPLSALTSLKCAFPVFATPRLAVTPPDIVSGTQEFSFAVDSFDYKKNRARIVGSGAALVTMMVTPTAMHIIEQTPVGNMNVTTVFLSGATGKTFGAVHSRHLRDATDGTAPSQAYGTCDVTP